MTVHKYISALLVSVVLACGSCVAKSEGSPCPSDGGVPVTGVVKQGPLPPNSPPITMFPYRVVVQVQSDFLVRSVEIGGSLAQVSSSNPLDWQADLFAADLERNRVGDEAHLEISATDFCRVPHPLQPDVVLPIGPASGIVVSDLKVTPEYSLAGECSVPLSGQVQALLRVTASDSSVGAAVTLQTSQGTFPGGSATQTLTLVRADDHSQQTTFLIPQKAGFAVVSAAAVGAVAEPAVVPVTAPPEITAPVTALKRGVDYFMTVRSGGHLQDCTIDHANTNLATVDVVKPDNLAGALGSKPSLNQDGNCRSAETVELKISFLSTAPDDGALTLRCFDTFGQSASTTFQVAKAN